MHNKSNIAPVHGKKSTNKDPIAKTRSDHQMDLRKSHARYLLNGEGDESRRCGGDEDEEEGDAEKGGPGDGHRRQPPAPRLALLGVLSLHRAPRLPRPQPPNGCQIYSSSLRPLLSSSSSISLSSRSGFFQSVEEACEILKSHRERFPTSSVICFSFSPRSMNEVRS